MLDLFAILTKGGIVLWMHSPLKQDHRAIINRFMQAVLVEGTAIGDTLVQGTLEIRWTMHSELDLVFLAAYQKILPLTYIPALLERVKEHVIKQYGPSLRHRPFCAIEDFDEPFLKIMTQVEQQDRQEHNKGKERASPYPTPSPSSKTKKSPPGESAIKGKQLRKWGDKATKKDFEMLDFSSNDSAAMPPLQDSKSIPLPSQNDGTLLELAYDEDKTVENYDHDDEEEDEEEEEENEQDFHNQTSQNSHKQSTGRLWSFYQTLRGQKEITKEDMITPLAQMKEHLISKNVASQVAEYICQHVAERLLGSKTGTFRTIATLVRRATEEAVTRILLPRSATAIPEEIRRLHSTLTNRPYVLAFIGVNGVGKSTSLSKVAFWLLQNNFRILVVAGDTFRSGAVEQLKTHVNNLSQGRPAHTIELFERGYGKDPAAIAKDAIAYAAKQGFHVVMVDTAGRMQDNAPLMQALAKLIRVNRPDKVIFVGEALVGNEAVDQLSKFNAALLDHSDPATPARIDGILLTKFDAIDDKVGAVLSMTFVAKAPVLFVGTGQTYMDLRMMNVKLVVGQLLK